MRDARTAGTQGVDDVNVSTNMLREALSPVVRESIVAGHEVLASIVGRSAGIGDRVILNSYRHTLDATRMAELSIAMRELGREAIGVTDTLALARPFLRETDAVTAVTMAGSNARVSKMLFTDSRAIFSLSSRIDKGNYDGHTVNRIQELVVRLNFDASIAQANLHHVLEADDALRAAAAMA